MRTSKRLWIAVCLLAVLGALSLPEAVSACTYKCAWNGFCQSCQNTGSYTGYYCANRLGQCDCYYFIGACEGFAAGGGEEDMVAFPGLEAVAAPAEAPACQAESAQTVAD